MNKTEFKVGISTYAWGFNGNLTELTTFLKDQDLTDLLIHILPCYIGERDGGFSPVNHREINPRYGNWEDVEHISRSNYPLLDIICCHLDEQSPEWQDYKKQGKESFYNSLFLTTEKIYSDGIVPETELQRFNFFGNPKRGLYTEILGDGSEVTRVQTFLDFQRDLDANSILTREYIKKLFGLWQSKGIRYCRLDAINTAVKEAGNYPDFYMTPGTYKYIDYLCDTAELYRITPLLELLVAEEDFEKLPQNCILYDFEYQKILIGVLINRDFSKLVEWLRIIKSKRGDRVILNIFSNHDGICWDSKFSPYSETEREELKKKTEARLTQQDLEASGFEANNIASNTNTSIYNLCEKNIRQWLFINVLFLFLPEGIPLFYYHDLLCGVNDYKAFRETKEGRYIMRSKFNKEYLENVRNSKDKKFLCVSFLLDLIKYKNTNDIFNDPYEITFMDWQRHSFIVKWKSNSRDVFMVLFNANEYDFTIRTTLSYKLKKPKV